ncbi:MAG: hypothetical protein A3J74_06365 [Elusimicrobia bacterium RIFCSPHIGHO2_02_FULL_57_9]|nr:MAG: hypothetical protein A3J74_06365 [Elusimicrobia bacterium RIFCSPHIGHO2_02_FULL_57_9]
MVIALDQGSSSSRALAIDSRGEVLAKAQFPIKTYYPQAGYVEHDALDIALTQEKALQAVLAKIPKSDNILGLGLACQRSTVIFWDRETGKPAARAPSWQDGRAAMVAMALQDHRMEAYESTGLYLMPYYSAPKIRWFIDNVPPVRKLLDQGRLLVGPVSSFLIWRLTRGAVFAADPSLAQRMMLFSLRSMDWDDPLLKIFSLPRHILPQIKPSCGLWGSFKAKGRVISILACLGDQQAAAIGLGGMEAGSSVLNYGTGAFFLHNTGTKQQRIPGLLTSIGWQISGQAPYFLQEGTVHAAGSSFEWLRENLGLLKKINDVEKHCRASKERVLALPAIGGLGAPRWDYAAKTVFFGLNSQTKASDLVRGVVESIAFLISDIVNAMRAGGLSPAHVSVSGGLSRIPYLMQFQSDILRQDLRRCEETEATALGAASLAVEGAGASWAGNLHKTKIDKIFKPAMEAAQAERLISAWTTFVAAQASLSRKIKLS